MPTHLKHRVTGSGITSTTLALIYLFFTNDATLSVLRTEGRWLQIQNLTAIGGGNNIERYDTNTKESMQGRIPQQV